MYFDFQIVAFTEITQSKIFSKKDGKFQVKIFLSYMASTAIAALMIIELWRIDKIFKNKRKEFNSQGKFLRLKNLMLKDPHHHKV
jgi:hypothetical protein